MEAVTDMSDKGYLAFSVRVAHKVCIFCIFWVTVRGRRQKSKKTMKTVVFNYFSLAATKLTHYMNGEAVVRKMKICLLLSVVWSWMELC